MNSMTPRGMVNRVGTLDASLASWPSAAICRSTSFRKNGLPSVRSCRRRTSDALAEDSPGRLDELADVAFVEAEQRKRHTLALGLGDQRGVLGQLLHFERTISRDRGRAHAADLPRECDEHQQGRRIGRVQVVAALSAAAEPRRHCGETRSTSRTSENGLARAGPAMRSVVPARRRSDRGVPARSERSRRRPPPSSSRAEPAQRPSTSPRRACAQGQ